MVGAVFQGNDPVFLRGALLKCLLICKTLRDVPNPEIPGLKEIGNPIAGEVTIALANLREWFGFREALFDDPNAAR
jgi:hypothetical protein